MKTETVQVSIPAELAEFVRQDMNVGAYGNWSEYVRDLLRRRREERIARDLSFLAEAVKNAPIEDPGQAFYDRAAALQKQIRREKKRF